jgi:ribosomal protein L20
MKTCNKCGETKALTEFYKQRLGRDGLTAQCKGCINIRKKAFREANPEKVKAFQKAYRETNKEEIKARKKVYREANKEKLKAYRAAHKERTKQYGKAWRQTPTARLIHYKKNAERRNTPFLLTEEEFKSFWQQPCSYCGAEIETIGLDRVDNDGPYHIDNVVSCCKSCNSSKNSKTLEEWQGREND